MRDVVITHTPFQHLKVTDVVSKKLYRVVCGFSMMHLLELANRMIDKGVGHIVFEEGFIAVVCKEIVETQPQPEVAITP